MKRNHTLALAAAAALCAGAFAQANAATLSDNFIVSATVNASCALTADDIAFGNWDPLSGDANTNGNITVTCSSALPYSVAIDLGSASSNGDCVAPARNMYNSVNGALIGYGLYQDAGHAQAWGCDASSDLDGTGTGGATAYAVYANIPSAQTVVDGYYQDNLVATITF